MKRLALIIVLLLLSWASVKAQYVRPDNEPAPPPVPLQQPKSGWDNTSVGGNFSLQFGTVTYVVLAPLINLHWKTYAMIGVGPYFQYLNSQDPYFGNIVSTVYGGRVVAMAFMPAPISRIFVQAEYDYLNVPNTYSYATNARADVGVPLIGAGFRQSFGNKCYFTMAILFDMSQSPLSPFYIAPNSYAPVFTAGIDIGL